MPKQSRFNIRMCMHILSFVCMGFIIGFSIFCWKNGAFSSQEELRTFVTGYGAAAGVIFTLIQVVQVVVPIIPGGVSCLAGVILFGTWKGLLYNYIGICVGSVIVFFLARFYGKPLLYKLFKQKKIEKYEAMTGSGKKFTVIFALLIFSPVAPDDMLCYLAGTTPMKARTFILIILLCKPFSILTYSLGLNVVFQMLLHSGQ